ncbi:MAG: branched-chain amino acid transaminase [Candidatus Anstonellales archaeon]
MLMWFNNKLIDEKDFSIHPLSHSLHYGDAAFEGLRAYNLGNKKTGIFRIREHANRLVYSSSVLMGKKVLTVEEVEKGIIETIRGNKISEAYIRPIFFLGNGTIGINNLDKNQRFFAVMALPFPPFLDKNKAIRVLISSYRKTPSICQPANAKISANYVNSILASREARISGYDEALLLNIHNRIAEGPGENIFIVKNEKLFTPPLDEDLLEGITRDSIIKLAEHMGIEVIEKPISIAELLNADEAFFTGTAAEVVGIGEVSGYKIGDGNIGGITKKLQSLYEKATKGKIKAFRHWVKEVKL